MVDQVRKALGPEALLIDNGFFLTPGEEKLAGEATWAHTGLCYTESLSSVGYSDTLDHRAAYLTWLATASAAYPNRTLIGHGKVTIPASTPDSTFMFGLAKYMLVTSSVSRGWFLANNGGYSIDEGLLDQPTEVYQGSGLGCGEPTAMMERVGGSGSYQFRRNFEHGNVTVDLKAITASINCKKD